MLFIPSEETPSQKSGEFVKIKIRKKRKNKIKFQSETFIRRNFASTGPSDGTSQNDRCLVGCGSRQSPFRVAERTTDGRHGKQTQDGTDDAIFRGYLTDDADDEQRLEGS